MVEPGAVIAGRYRVVRRLGAGAMATVHLARDTVLDRDVAIKRVHAAPDSEHGRRIHREARLGAGLAHENLVAVFDVLSEDDAVLLVTEYVDGETLADALRRGRLEPERALAVLGPLAAALDHVHAAGVIHRDVKPANVLLGERGVVKLADLGVATSADTTRITSSGALLGTIAYMAPEQFEPGDVTAAADIFALATVAYEMLAGRRPVTGANAFEVMARLRDAPPPDLREALAEAPAAAAEALRRSLARDPATRHVTARALVDDLEAAWRPREAPAAEPRAAVAPSRPASARRPSRPQPAVPAPAVRPARRARRAPAPAAVLLGLGAAGAILALATGGAGDDGSESARVGTGSRTSRTTPQRTVTQRPSRVAASPGTPRGAVRAFYERAARGDLDAAWDLAGPRMRAAFGGSRERFDTTLGTLRAITFSRLEQTSRDGERATVAIATTARHTTRTDRCEGALTATRAGGRWLVEPAGVRCRAA